jgi:branched-chain amino acid transport system permease protein
MHENRLHQRHPLVQFVMDNWIYVVIAIVMWQLPHWLGDYFDKPISNLEPPDVRGNAALSWMAVAIELYILAILAMSYNLILGFSGILSFGHALFFGTGVYVVIILFSTYSQPLMSSIGVALSLAVLLGLFMALAAYRIKGIYFAMFTLAMAQVFYELSRVNLFRFLTNGDDGLRFTGDITPPISLTINRIDLYYVCAIAAGVTFLFIRRLMNSPTGKVIIAIRDNEERTQTMGYNIYRYKALVIVLGSALGTLAGVLHALASKGVEPGVLSVSRTVEPLLMTIIGGMGTNPGPVVGAALLHLGETFFSKPDLQINLNFILFRYTDVVDTKSNWALALGVLFVVIVMIIPYGVVGQVNKLWIQLRRWGRKFIYDRLIRRYPGLAAYMEPFTGEPPGVALAFAEASREASLAEWAIEHPFGTSYSGIILIAAAGGILSWDIQTFFSLCLFFWLLTLPVVIGVWVYKNREQYLPYRVRLSDQGKKPGNSLRQE